MVGVGAGGSGTVVGVNGSVVVDPSRKPSRGSSVVVVVATATRLFDATERELGQLLGFAGVKLRTGFSSWAAFMNAAQMRAG